MTHPVTPHQEEDSDSGKIFKKSLTLFFLNIFKILLFYFFKGSDEQISQETLHSRALVNSANARIAEG